MKRVRVVLLATHVPGPHEARARCGRTMVERFIGLLDLMRREHPGY